MLIEHAIEVVVQNNLRWYAAEVARGESPPCCSHCAGLDYRDATPKSRTTPQQTIKSFTQMLEDGWGSCADICAWDCAVMRAKDGLDALVIPIEMEPGYFHTFIGVPDPREQGGLRLEDPTAEWTGHTCSACAVRLANEESPSWSR